MELTEYQIEAQKFALYLDKIVYPLLGLNGEAGEMANKYKKVLRGDVRYLDARDALIQELGDVLWYVAALATDLGVSLDTVAEQNLLKLQSRYDRNMIKGNGDDR